MKNLNYDNFHVKPGSAPEMFCHVCNSKMDLIPFDPHRFKGIGMGGAIMKFVYNWDEFVCPKCDLQWHEQAARILKAIDKSPSSSMKEIMRKDYETIIEENAG